MPLALTLNVALPPCVTVALDGWVVKLGGTPDALTVNETVRVGPISMILPEPSYLSQYRSTEYVPGAGSVSNGSPLLFIDVAA